MAQQPIRVVVEHKKSGGCGTVLLVMILIGLAIKYWYVALGIAVVIGTIALVANEQQREKQREAQRHRTGPRDPWLNEVAVALADLGLTEVARNTGGQLGGMPLEGDIGLQDGRLLVYVNLFSYAERTRQAEIGLRANPKIREAIGSGQTVVKAEDRVLFVATSRGGVVDEFRLEEIVQVVGEIALPPSLGGQASAGPILRPSTAMSSALRAPVLSLDAVEQIRKLGQLRDAGVLTEAEFDAKKTELLRRV